MGYTTDFTGQFTLDRPLDDDTFTFLQKLSKTRRMKRALGPEYGVEGEFYVDGSGFHGQDHEPSVLNYNEPPATQPGLWCHWTPTDDRLALEWDGGEKFYYYVEWLEYLVKTILAPRGYVLNGEVHWSGEEEGDIGLIRVRDNVVVAQRATVTYDEPTPQPQASSLVTISDLMVALVRDHEPIDHIAIALPDGYYDIRIESNNSYVCLIPNRKLEG